MAGRHVGHLSTKKSTRQHGRQGSVEGTTLVPYCSQLAPWPPAGVISRGLTMMPPVLPLPFLAWQRSVRRQSSYSAHSAAVGATEGGGAADLISAQSGTWPVQLPLTIHPREHGLGRLLLHEPTLYCRASTPEFGNTREAPIEQRLTSEVMAWDAIVIHLEARVLESRSVLVALVPG